MKNSVRTSNNIMWNLVECLEKKARVGKKGAKILRTLSKSAIITFFGLSYWDSVPADLISDTSQEDNLEDIRLVYFYPDDLCKELNISRDSLRRALNELDDSGFIHYFSPIHDDNNYVIYRVGLDPVSDPATPKGAGGYVTTDRAFYDAIKEIDGVARLRVYIRLYQENARTNNGRDLFESRSAKSLLAGLPIYTTRPAFLKWLSDEALTGGEKCISGISFRKKNRRRYDIEMTGCYSYKQRQESREDNVNRLIENSRKLGKLGRWFRGNLVGTPDADNLLSDPGKAMTLQVEARQTYKELFGEELSDENLYGIYGFRNPYSLSTFETFIKFLDPSSGNRINNTAFRSLADEYGAERCFRALKKLWHSFLTGTIKNLSANKSAGNGQETNLLALARNIIWNESPFPKKLFTEVLETFGSKKIKFRPDYSKLAAI